MTKRARPFEAYALVLALVAMIFCALAQLVLALPRIFGPSRGELPWPATLVAILVSVVVIAFAARKDGALLELKWFVWVLAALSWSALFVMITFSESPWQLLQVSQWMGRAEPTNFLRPGLWRPLHVLHFLGPVALVLAASARRHPPAKRKQVVLAGVVPWALGSALYAYLLTLPRPIYMG